MFAGMTVGKSVGLGGDLGQQFEEQCLFSNERPGAGVVWAGAFAEVGISDGEVVFLEHPCPWCAEIERLAQFGTVVAQALEIGCKGIDQILVGGAFDDAFFEAEECQWDGLGGAHGCVRLKNGGARQAQTLWWAEDSGVGEEWIRI